MTVLIKSAQTQNFRIDDATIINRCDFATNAYDIVKIQVKGTHGTMMNKRSTKTYYITSGMGVFNIDDCAYCVEAGDLISVEAKCWLSIKGDLEALVITNPPFCAEDELWR